MKKKKIAKIEAMEEVLEGSTGQKIELTIDAEEQQIILDALRKYKGILRMEERYLTREPLRIDPESIKEIEKGVIRRELKHE